MQGDDSESCGHDIPQPLLRSNGELFVNYASYSAAVLELARRSWSGMTLGHLSRAGGKLDG